MKKLIALLMALSLMGCSALAEVPQLSGRLFDCAKAALRCLSSGEYERLVTDLPCSDASPSAAEWERFAASFSDLSGCQTQYAVAYWRDGRWSVAVPVREPSGDGVEVLVLTSSNGSSFNGYRCASWGKVRAEYAGSDHVYWNQEYLSADLEVMPDSMD